MPPQHLKVAAVDLDVVPLGKCIRQCNELNHVQWIYPSHPINDLWIGEQARQTEEAQNQANDPYARRMFIGMKVENPVMESRVSSWDAPAPPSDLDL